MVISSFISRITWEKVYYCFERHNNMAVAALL